MVASNPNQPNVLVIITDQHRADHVGFGGNTVVRTPHLDALAARSTVFDRAYVANPVCSPNRSSIITGRMPSSHGVIFNDRSLGWGASTFVRSLRSAGYRTALIGKSHFQVGLDRHGIPPGPPVPAVGDAHPDEVYGYEFPERYFDDDFVDPDDFYGFATIELALDHGARFGGHHLRWALERGASFDEVVVPMTNQAPGTRRSPRWWQIYQPPYAAELHSTNFVAERTMATIEEAAAGDQPWMVWASFPDPHHPMVPPGPWFDRHDPDDMEVPATFDDPLAEAPPHVQGIRAKGPRKMWPFPFGTDDRRLVQEALAATYGMIELIDDGVGRILATLDRVKASDNTIVVFTADHGDMMGDHGLMLKGNLHYQGVARVPLTIAAPGQAPGRSPALASSIDLAPTILDLCQVDAFDGLQGTPLTGILEDRSARVREALLIEDDMPPTLAPFLGVPTRMRTVVTETARYTRASDGSEQLFDLAQDPQELDDLSRRDQGRRNELRDLLLDQLMEADDMAGGVPVDRCPS